MQAGNGGRTDRQATRGVWRWWAVMAAMTAAVLVPGMLGAAPGPAAGPLHATVLEQDATPGMPVAERLVAMQATYAAAAPVAMQAPACLALADARLDDLFHATALIAFYARDVAAVERLDCLYAALAARQRATPAHHQAMRGAWISLQRFDRANALNARFAEPPTLLPTIAGERLTGRPLLQLDGPGQLQRAVLADDGLRVVAVVHPYCGFSRRALEAITASPEYGWLRQHLQLVVPIGQQWPGPALLAWNAAHPDLPMRAIQASPAWQGIEVQETPLFHLVRDGTVIHTVRGWPEGGADLQDIRRALGAGSR